MMMIIMLFYRTEVVCLLKTIMFDPRLMWILNNRCLSIKKTNIPLSIYCISIPIVKLKHHGHLFTLLA